MAGRRGEPELPAAYLAIHAAHHRLADAERQLRWRQSVDEAIVEEERRLRPLWELRERELADVDELESRTLRSLRSRLNRTHQDALQAEQADVQLVEAEIVRRLEAIEALDAGPGPATVEEAGQAVEQAKRDLERSLAWWRDEHVAIRSHLGNRLVELDRVDSYLRALRRESHEALDAARLAIAALEIARRAVRPIGLADMFRPPDLPLGQSIGDGQRWLLELRTELADLRRIRPPTVAGAEVALPPLHVGTDDVFDDWIVDNRIVATPESIDPSLARVRRVVSGLDRFLERLDNQIENLQEEVRDLLLQHPGDLRRAD